MEGGGGQKPSIRHELGEERADRLRARVIEREMRERRNSRDSDSHAGSSRRILPVPPDLPSDVNQTPCDVAAHEFPNGRQRCGGTYPLRPICTTDERPLSPPPDVASSPAGRPP